MEFLDSSTVLSNIIAEKHYLIPVINRFGIKLGVGDMAIGTICKSHNINTEFFLVILNTYINEDYFPERRLQKFDIELVIDFLNRTDIYLVNALIYNLEKHLNAFISMSDPNNTQLELIRRLFIRFKNELTTQIKQNVSEANTSLELLVDLKNIFIKHISGNYNENLCYGVVFSIDSLQRDLLNHNRIKTKVLKPMIYELEQSGIEDWQDMLASSSNIKEKNDDQPLSQREIDVLRLVALGNINKEIADKLNISLNTVLSHRKNITAKLGIKTVSGLIFYCIMHGYISADESKL